MGKASQRKGRAAELEFARILQGYGYPAEPGPPMSYGKAPDVTGLPGIHIELKRRENPDLPGALKQARQDAERFGDGLPVVFTRRNRGRWLAVMELSDFMTLYARKN